MSQTAALKATDTGVPITGTVTCSDPTFDMTTVASAVLIISGVGQKTATVGTKTTTSVNLSWTYDGTLTAGGYNCWWKVTYAGGSVQTSPTRGTLSLTVEATT